MEMKIAIMNGSFAKLSREAQGREITPEELAAEIIEKLFPVLPEGYTPRSLKMNPRSLGTNPRNLNKRLG